MAGMTDSESSKEAALVGPAVRARDAAVGEKRPARRRDRMARVDFLTNRDFEG
jgi:hypothetical protein